MAKSAKGYLGVAWNSLWNKNDFDCPSMDAGTKTALFEVEQEINATSVNIGKSLEDAKRIKSVLERSIKEVGEGFDEFPLDDFGEVIADYRQTCKASQFKDSKTARTIDLLVIRRLNDMLLDCNEGLRKVTHCFKAHEDLAKDLVNSNSKEKRVAIDYQIENERILTKELNHFSMETDKNIKLVLGSFFGALEDFKGILPMQSGK